MLSKVLRTGAFVGALLGVMYLMTSETSLHSRLVLVAERVSKEVPQQLDDYTRMVAVSALPPDILLYRYTVDVIRGELSDAQTNEVRNATAPVILNSIRTRPEMETLRSWGVRFRYA